MKYRVFAALLLMIAPLGLQASSVELKNGDVIHGDLLEMECGKLTICSDCAGKVCVSCDCISSLVVDKEMNITLSDGQVVEGRIEWGREEGQVMVVDGCSHETFPVELCCISTIRLPCAPCPKPPRCCTEGWKGKWSLGYATLTGNSRSESLNIDLCFKKEWCFDGHLDHSWKFYAEQRYKEDWKDQDHVNKGKYGVFYEQWFAPRWTWIASEEMRYDQEKDLKWRLDTGLSLGYKLFCTDCLDWQLQAGIAVVDAFYTYKKDDEHTFNLPLGSKLCWKFWKNLAFHYRTEWSPAVTGPKDFWWDNDFEIRIPLTCRGDWNLSVEYDLNYHSEPPSNKNKYDRAFDVKLTYCY